MVSGGILFILAGLLLQKGMDLSAMGTNVDGDGIGIDFLGAEVTHRVPEHKIPRYATDFYIASAVTTVIALALIVSKFIPSLKLRPTEK